MSKVDALKSWINPLYLEKTDAYSRENLIDGVILDEFFLPERLAQVEEFMRYEAEYRELYRTTDKGQPSVSREEWLSYPENKRFCFRNLVSRAKQQFQGSINHRAYCELWSLLESPAFVGLLANITRQLYVPKVWAAVCHRQGHFLASHNDVAPGRKLGIVLYLSKGWQPEFGGELTVFEGNREAKKIEPLFNRLVLLETIARNAHKVELLTPEAKDWPRFCFVIRCMDPRSIKIEKSE